MIEHPRMNHLIHPNIYVDLWDVSSCCFFCLCRSLAVALWDVQFRGRPCRFTTSMEPVDYFQLYMRNCKQTCHTPRPCLESKGVSYIKYELSTSACCKFQLYGKLLEAPAKDIVRFPYGVFTVIGTEMYFCLLPPPNTLIGNLLAGGP